MILGIYGAGGLGAEIHELALIINNDSKRWDKIIYIDDTPEKKETVYTGCKVINYEMLAAYEKKDVELIIALGEPRFKDFVFKKVEADGYTVTNLMHPGTRIMNGATLGRGIIVHGNNGIPPMSVIGNNVLIQGSAIMGHGVVLGDNVVISSFAFVGGETVIGKDTYIAPHSCLRDKIHIGEGVVIGMGSVVTKDIPDNAVAYGNPCTVKRINDKEKIFNK